MKVELELWHLMTMGFMFVGVLFGFGKIWLARIEKDFATQATNLTALHNSVFERLNSIERQRASDLNSHQELEKEVIRLRGDMSTNFVMREDYVKGQSRLEAKIDSLAMKLENVMFRMLEGGRNAN